MRTQIARFEIGKYRVTIFQRADGSIGYSEDERFEDGLSGPYWTPSHQDSEMYCDSLAVAIREVVGRVDWLRAALSEAKVIRRDEYE